MPSSYCPLRFRCRKASCSGEYFVALSAPCAPLLPLTGWARGWLCKCGGRGRSAVWHPPGSFCRLCNFSATCAQHPFWRSESQLEHSAALAAACHSWPLHPPILTALRLRSRKASCSGDSPAGAAEAADAGAGLGARAGWREEGRGVTERPLAATGTGAGAGTGAARWGLCKAARKLSV